LQTPTIVNVNYQVTITTNRDPLNVRSEPSTTGGARTIIGSVPRLSLQTITGEADGPGATKWLRLRIGNQDGFISRDHTQRVAVTVPANTFSMQALASRNWKDADKVVGRLIAAGFPNAYRTNVNGWYQARVGPYSTRESALAKKPRLKELGYKDAFLVRND
jgi:hypothetical protein